MWRVLRVALCVLRFALYVLRFTFYVSRFAFYVLAFCVSRFSFCVLRSAFLFFILRSAFCVRAFGGAVLYPTEGVASGRAYFGLRFRWLWYVFGVRCMRVFG